MLGTLFISWGAGNHRCWQPKLPILAGLLETTSALSQPSRICTQTTITSPQDHDLEIKLRKVNEFLEDGLK